MRLVACQTCKAQYDVSNVELDHIRCHCGTAIPNSTPKPVDAPMRRCASCGAAIGLDVERCSYCDSVIERKPGKLSLICPECYARNPEHSRFCTGCGIEFRPQPILAEGEQLACPCCARPMQARGIVGLGVHECLLCHGLWVQGESFDALVARAIESWKARTESGEPVLPRERCRRRATFPDKVVYRRCPVCDSPMSRKNFGRVSGVIVDWCGAHGTWLDADELEAIADFILSGRGAAAAGGAAAVSTLRFPSPDVVRARVEAERLKADEMARSKERWEKLFDRHTGVGIRFGVTDLIDALMKIAGPAK